ncbi:MAG: hypothetical protein M1823_005704, partial [Watsoniomyces obsoletus]
MTSPGPHWKHRSPAVTSSSTDNETPYPRQQGVTDVLERQTRDDRRAIHEATMSRDQTPSSAAADTPQESAALFGQLPAAPSLVQRFTGDGHGETDPETFLEDVEVLALSLRPADEEQTDKALRTQFRWHLAGPAATWLRELPADKKQSWGKLKEAFLAAYKKGTTETEGEKRKRIQDEMQAYRQGEKESLDAYIQRGQRLIDAIPGAGFMIEDRFIQGLAEEGLLEAVRVHLSLRGKEYTHEDAKEVAKAVQRGKEQAQKDKKAVTRHMAGGHTTSQTGSPPGSGAGSGTDSAVMRRDIDSLAKQMERVVLGGDERGKYTPPRPVRCEAAVATARRQPATAARPPASQRRIEQRPTDDARYRPADDDRYGPTAKPSRINCIMADDGSNRVATTYHEPAMAAIGEARRSGRTDPATGRINRTPAGPRFTQPNDARQPSRAHQTIRPTQQARQGSTETLRPIDEDVVMGNNNDDDDDPPRRRPAAGPRELVPVRPPKANPPIRAIQGEERYTIDEALGQEVSLTMKQLLDISPPARKQMAFALQLATPRCRRVRVPQSTVRPAGAVNHAVAAGSRRPVVSTKAHQDDNQASLFFITAWVSDIPVDNTLVDGRSMVDLISSRVVNQMLGTPIRRNDSLKIILANDRRMTLDGYVSVHVNVEGVTATVKAFVMPEATGY